MGGSSSCCLGDVAVGLAEVIFWIDEWVFFGGENLGSAAGFAFDLVFHSCVVCWLCIDMDGRTWQ